MDVNVLLGQKSNQQQLNWTFTARWLLFMRGLATSALRLC